MPDTATVTRGLADDFREAMRRLAASVVMVTTWLDDQPWGLTVSACCSVSVTPPSLLVSVGEYTATAGVIRDQRHFGVSILGEDQSHVAKFGARPREPKFVSEFCDPDAGNHRFAPVVRGAIAHLDCRCSHIVEVADHIVFVAEVERVVLNPDDRPLLYYASDFHRLESPGDASIQPETEGLLYPPW